MLQKKTTLVTMGHKKLMQSQYKRIVCLLLIATPRIPGIRPFKSTVCRLHPDFKPLTHCI